MAGLFGVDGPIAVFFLIFIVYGAPVILTGIYDNFYILLGVFCVFALVSFYVIFQNPKEYLSVFY